MNRRFLGLDLRDQSVSAVVVTRDRRGTRIESHARVLVTPSPGEENGLPEALKVLRGNVDPRGCSCAVSIPPGQAAYRNLQIPFDHPKKIRQVLPFEMEPSLPYPVGEVSIGFQPLTAPKGPGGGPTCLVTASVRKDRLQVFLDALAEMKVHPDTVTVGGYPAARLMASRQNGNDALLVDLDDTRCAVFALSAGEVKTVRAFSTGDDEAGDTLCSRVFQTCRAMEEMLSGDFRPEIGFVVGTGPGGQDPSPALADKLGIPVKRADFSREITGADIDWEPARMENALALALAEAEGLEGLNFRPGPAGLTRLWAENRPSLVRTAVLAGVMLLLALAGVFLDMAARKSRLEMLNRQIAAVFTDTFPEVRTVVDPLQQMRVKVQEARQAAGESEGAEGRLRVVDILREINLRIPATIDVDLSQAMIGPEGVRISGFTNGFEAVDRIKNSLTGTPGFSSISIASATVEKSGGRIQFKLNMAR